MKHYPREHCCGEREQQLKKLINGPHEAEFLYILD